jgi:hypothetical protein
MGGLTPGYTPPSAVDAFTARYGGLSTPYAPVARYQPSPAQVGNQGAASLVPANLVDALLRQRLYGTAGMSAGVGYQSPAQVGNIGAAVKPASIPARQVVAQAMARRAAPVAAQPLHPALAAAIANLGQQGPSAAASQYAAAHPAPFGPSVAAGTYVPQVAPAAPYAYAPAGGNTGFNPAAGGFASGAMVDPVAQAAAQRAAALNYIQSAGPSATEIQYPNLPGPGGYGSTSGPVGHPTTAPGLQAGSAAAAAYTAAQNATAEQMSSQQFRDTLNSLLHDAGLAPQF